MNKKLANPQVNIISVFIAEIIGMAITFSVDYSGAGMAAVIVKWIPAIIGIVTLFIYLISRLFINKYNWIISVLGIILILFSAIKVYTTDFTLAT